MRWLLHIFLVVLVSALLSACGDSSVPPVRESGELVVLTREGPTTYANDDTLGAVGFEHDLAELFAEELGVKARFIVAESDVEIYLRLKDQQAHLAAAWLTPVEDPDLTSSAPYQQSYNVLVSHEASVPIADISQLAGKTVHVVAESRQATALAELADQLPNLTVVGETGRRELDLLEDVASQRLAAAVVDHAVFDIGSNYYPELQGSLKIGPTRPVAWLLAAHGDSELPAKADAFIARIARDGTLARLRDRYFGHVERLTQTDVVVFVERIRKLLPQYRPLFQAAQATTGIDWRLLAALAYQESQWDPLATSPTGVRGMMMLTGETADRMGVGNRLDPKQSIRAGAQYLSDLRDALPPEIREPDRMWLALAAYNLGMGHLQGARMLAKGAKANPNLWFEMKRVLPLLTRPEYYERLKSGKARGGEAVTLVENIRIFSDILNRYQPALRPLEEMAGMTGMEGVVGGGLKAETPRKPGLGVATRSAPARPNKDGAPPAR